MAVDYYKVLKLNRNASDEEIKRSFKRLAMKWHPDKNPLDRKDAEAKFKLITQAYDVLGDPRRRQIYDLDSDNGEAGVNQRKPEAVETKLLCSLEELYNGNRRKLRISRTVANDFGRPKTVEETLKIDILPGWKKGTKVTFPGKGNKSHGVTPADLIFVVDEKPHPVFRRDGNDLVVNQKVSLLEALTGKQIELTTLDGRLLTIPVMDIIKPGYQMMIPDEGMPISKEPGMKGKLRIKFDITFPCRLSVEQKSDLKRVLGGADK